MLVGAVGGVAGTVLWLAVVLVAPPIPASPGLALALAAVAAAGAVLAGLDRAEIDAAGLLAGVIAIAGTLLSIFVAVLVLAHWGPDSLIPDVTPQALPGQHVSESRIEIVDPYVLVLALGVLAALAGGLLVPAARGARRVTGAAVSRRPSR